jgi:hypothetical protein
MNRTRLPRFERGSVNRLWFGRSTWRQAADAVPLRRVCHFHQRQVRTCERWARSGGHEVRRKPGNVAPLTPRISCPPSNPSLSCQGSNSRPPNSRIHTQDGFPTSLGSSSAPECYQRLRGKGRQRRYADEAAGRSCFFNASPTVCKARVVRDQASEGPLRRRKGEESAQGT